MSWVGGASKKVVGTEIIYDYDTAKYNKVDLNTGESALCDVQGHPVPSFYPYFTGFASTLDRKEEGRINNIPDMETIENIPKYLGKPVKYVGYQQVPRPGIKMAAASHECPYTLPTYLEPIPPKLGKVSVKVKDTGPKKFLSSQQRALPSFQHTLDSQYAPSLSMSNYLNRTLQSMHNTGDVAALKAKNKALVMGAGFDLMAELRKYRMNTKGAFASKHPPYTPLEVKLREKERDLLVNPTKNRKENEEYEEDKANVIKRRRDRYLQYFVEREEKERALAAV